MGAYLSSPVTEKETFDGVGKDLKYGGSSMQGWRRNMEDAHFACASISEAQSDIAAFGVFDGHGGCEVAKFCQKYLPVEFQNVDGYPDDMETALINVFHRMDEMLKENSYQNELESFRTKNEENENENSGDPASQSPSDVVMRQLDMMRRFFSGSNTSSNPTHNTGTSAPRADLSPDAEDVVAADGPLSADSCVQSGSTAIVAVKKGRCLYVANAGDSRAVLCRGRVAMALSEDHKPILDRERNRIEAAGGFLSEIAGMYRVNGNLNLSRAIGDLKYKTNTDLARGEQIISAEPEVIKVQLKDEDKFFVLACDGIWDVMDNQEVVDFILAKLEAGKKISDISRELLDKCLALDPKLTRGIGCDNMTILIVALDKPSPIQAVKETKPEESLKQAQATAEECAIVQPVEETAKEVNVA